MPRTRVTVTKEMLQSLLENLQENKALLSEFMIEKDEEGVTEITRFINLYTGDVFEQIFQNQPRDCKIYEFPLEKTNKNHEAEDNSGY